MEVSTKIQQGLFEGIVVLIGLKLETLRQRRRKRVGAASFFCEAETQNRKIFYSLLKKFARPPEIQIGKKIFLFCAPLVGAQEAAGWVKNPQADFSQKKFELRSKTSAKFLNFFKNMKPNRQNKKVYVCPECNLKYKEEHWAKKCEAWCKETKSCNLDIIKHAVEESVRQE